MRKPKYDIIMETAPSQKYKTKEEKELILQKVNNIIINYFINELNRMDK